MLKGSAVNESKFFVFAGFIFASVTVLKCICIVPQGEEWIGERLRKYRARPSGILGRRE
jgi:regulator of protease activity HflC (stomatin/prohibitin superfamily)